MTVEIAVQDVEGARIAHEEGRIASNCAPL